MNRLRQAATGERVYDGVQDAQPSLLSPSPLHEPLRMNTVSPLAQACRALWLATLSLMTAFMQTGAPAHRHLLARRIAANLDTLAAQDCFTADCRATFGKLAVRWRAQAHRLAPQRGTEPGFKLARLLTLR